jgi:hypothetical protein
MRSFVCDNLPAAPVDCGDFVKASFLGAQEAQISWRSRLAGLLALATPPLD